MRFITKSQIKKCIVNLSTIRVMLKLYSEGSPILAPDHPSLINAINEIVDIIGGREAQQQLRMSLKAYEGLENLKK